MSVLCPTVPSLQERWNMIFRTSNSCAATHIISQAAFLNLNNHMIHEKIILWLWLRLDDGNVRVSTDQVCRRTTGFFCWERHFLCGVYMKYLAFFTLVFISWEEWNMVLIVVLGSKHHDLNVHSAILLEVSRSCRFCNLNPKQIQPLPSAVFPSPNPEAHACMLPKQQRQNASAKAFCTEPHGDDSFSWSVIYVMLLLPE